MRLTFTATAALCSIASAFPFPWARPSALAPWEQLVPPPAGTTFYQLQTKSTVTAVNNQWVALRTGQSTYSLGSGQAQGTKFFVRQYTPTGTYAFYNADDTRQVALRGPNGVLLYAVDVTNPSTDTIPGGQLMEWATFTMDNNLLGVKDGSTLTNRTFVGVRGSDGVYSLAFYDGVSNTTETISPLTVSIVRAA